MTVRAQLRPLPKALLAVAAAVGCLAVVLGNAPLALGVGCALAWLLCRALTVRIEGGGFRPLRTIDLIEFAASDQLDAYDREVAQEEANRRAMAQRNAPRW